MKIIHITDIHVRPRGETIYGVDSAARLATIVEDVNARHADADLVAVTGDLTHYGEPEAYEILADLTGRLTVPVKLLLGNHDDRANFRARFPEAPVDGNGFVQSFIDAPGAIGRLVFLDTHEAGWSGGRFCEQRLAWLDQTLSEAGERPATIFMHHPPLPFGVAHFEKICLHEPEAFLARLKAHPGGIRHLFIGHIHLPLTGVLPGGIPFTAGRGCSHQIVLEPGSPDCTWAAGVANYNIIELGEDSLFVHSFDKIGVESIGIGNYPPGP
ncbi:MAG: phosphodiesterase [Chelatococcus sp.]|nr:MAG: phosphodiesterase [Chelatococcus sp.]